MTDVSLLFNPFKISDKSGSRTSPSPINEKALKHNVTASGSQSSRTPLQVSNSQSRLEAKHSAFVELI